MFLQYGDMVNNFFSEILINFILRCVWNMLHICKIGVLEDFMILQEVLFTWNPGFFLLQRDLGTECFHVWHVCTGAHYVPRVLRLPTDSLEVGATKVNLINRMLCLKPTSWAVSFLNSGSGDPMPQANIEVGQAVVQYKIFPQPSFILQHKKSLEPFKRIASS